MGNKDTLTKDYMKNAQVFADAFNHLIYQGKKGIEPELLHSVDTAEVAVPYGKDKKKTIPYPVQKYRDELKLFHAMEDGKVVYVLLGVENQSEIHYAMPVKDMVYDALGYASQVEETAKKNREEKRQGSSAEFLSGFYKEDVLIPIITLVVYFGADQWDGPRRLHEMFDMKDEKILSMVPDYKINLIAPAEMSDEEFDHFTTDLREVLLFLKYSKNKKKLKEIVETDSGFHEMKTQTVLMLNELTNAKLKIHEGKETQNMCTAIDEIREEARLQGELQGELRGEQKGKIVGALLCGKNVKEISELLGVSEQKVLEVKETEGL